jgi:hypothetical protein
LQLAKSGLQSRYGTGAPEGGTGADRTTTRGAEPVLGRPDAPHDRPPNRSKGVCTVIARVTVVDADSAGDLIRRLVQEVEAEHVCFESERQQVCVDVQRNPDHTLGKVLSVVEDWLGETGRPPTRIEIDERTYVLAAREREAVR